MRFLRGALGIALSAAGLWFALRGTDWAAMRATFAQVRAPAWFLLLPVSVLFEFWMRTWRWRTLLALDPPAPQRAFLPITAAGFFLNNVLPFRAGELARVYWTRRRTGLPVTGVLAVLAADRFVDMACLLTIILWVLVRKAALFPSTRPLWIFGAVTLGGLAGILWAARFPAAVRRLAASLRLPSFLIARLEEFLDGARALRGTGTLLFIYAISLAFWSVNIAAVQWAVRVFSLALSWTDAAWLIVSFCFGALLPAAPGYVGLVEAAGVAALGLLGYPKAVAFPVVATLHLGMILTTALYGLPSLYIVGRPGPAPAETRDSA